LRNMEKTDPMRHDPGATARKGRLIRGGLALLALLLCAGLAAGPALAGTEPAGARTGGAAFSDIGGHWAADFIEWAVAQGISAGYGDGTFRPGAVVSEREFIAFEAANEEAEGRKPAGEFALRGIRIGDAESAVLEALGEPDRRDAAADGSVWLVYNRDYGAYAMIGVSGGTVTALFSNANAWQHDGGVVPGAAPEAAAAHAGVQEARVAGSGTFSYSKDGLDITLYLDRPDGSIVEGVLVKQAPSGATAGGRPAAAGAGSAAGDALSMAYERQIFDMTNAFRVKKGLAALAWNGLAAEAARAHSADMAARGYFDHVNPDGQSPGDRMKAAGLDGYAAWAENIAAGYGDPFAAFNGWTNSSGHRSNILQQGLEELGVGVVHDADSPYRWYYTQNFYTPPRR